ncbi:hypothetical protein HDU87_006662 [Geranomyces variabilis]|uniref:Glutamine amidotransferase type-2 domain-containing protein n=1 Tax=Geranomyces variabilis TaxID=109894 RepID=A0AAD5THJ6_9FUNG|nr:hypothetical protein HDU87_006662 [Geranomyces variabilis]
MYGLSFLYHLRGEFALCLWDERRKLFGAARDRFGIKPLYYTYSEGRLLLASETKAFKAFGWVPEWDKAEVSYTEATIDVQLPAASYLTCTLGGNITVQPYWDADYPDKNVPETRSKEEMIQGVHDRLVESIRLRMHAEVPLAIYLSGGIDSAAIAGISTSILRETDPTAKIHAFTIEFPGGGSFDESAIARRMATHVGAHFHPVPLSEQELADNFEDAIYHFEHPMPDLNAVGKFLLSKAARHSGFKVVLTGEGSDEHFAGYSFFLADALRETDSTLSERDRAELLACDKRIAKLEAIEGIASPAQDEVSMAKISGCDSQAARTMLNGISTHCALAASAQLSEFFFEKRVLEGTGKPDAAFALAGGLNGIARAKAASKYAESRTFLSNVLCNVLGDRSEMAHSIEGRTPFLDHLLCEYVNGIPPYLKIRPDAHGNIVEKWILREAVKPYISEELYARRKHPYLAPPVKDTTGPLGQLFTTRLTRKTVEKLGWASWEAVEKLKRDFDNTGDMSSARNLMVVLSFVVLCERFDVKPYKPRHRYEVDR